jgi:hypothetical protein
MPAILPDDDTLLEILGDMLDRSGVEARHKADLIGLFRLRLKSTETARSLERHEMLVARIAELLRKFDEGDDLEDEHQ